MALTQAVKSWSSNTVPSSFRLGYPSLKEDGTPFDEKDFTTCVRDIRPVATQIGNDTDLTKYQLSYDKENRRIPMPHNDDVSLIPPIRKHTFAPEVDPTGLIDDEAEFEALSGIDWASSSFQDKTAGGEVEKDNSESSSPPKE